jgi:hypothetical protein
MPGRKEPGSSLKIRDALKNNKSSLSSDALMIITELVVPSYPGFTCYHIQKHKTDADGCPELIFSISF